MKKLLLSSASIFVLATVAANAADLPLKAAPQRVVAPMPKWTGFYFGGTVGISGHSANLDYFQLWDDEGYSSEYGGPQRNSSAGFGAGIYLGYNWQVGNVVWGIEGDISAHTNRVTEIFEHVDSEDQARLESKLDAFGSVRLRLGYPVGNVMPYITGGVAFAHTKNTYVVFDKSINFVRKKWDWGWVVGGGIEWMMLPRVIVRAEALYARLDGGTISDSGGYFSPSVQLDVKDQEIAIARVGAALKF
jgi:outer membrane immunogenic protein